MTVDVNAAPADVTVGIPTRNRARLLRGSIESVLGQKYCRFTLVVSDNASDDDTRSVVASFRDPRIVYRPVERKIDRAANFNRLIELAETEFLLLLSDDDELHPDHLALTLEVLKRWPDVGLAHTAYRIVDEAGNPLNPVSPTARPRHSVVRESGAQFLERSMSSGPTVCFSSATFRRAALAGGGGLHPEDGEVDDFSLLMRIATRWDFAYLSRPLALLRVHGEASSSTLGAFTPDGFRSQRSLPDALYENRRRFLAQADLPATEASRLATAAERAYRRDVIHHLSMRAATGDGLVGVFGALGREFRHDPHLVVDPVTWRFVIGQLGARQLRDMARKWRGSGPRPQRRSEAANHAEQLLDDVAGDQRQA
jgi:hypothetical protein